MWFCRFKKVLVSCLIIASGGVLAASDVYQPGPVASLGIAKITSDIPLSFEENMGQTEKSVRFLSRGMGSTTFFRNTDMVVVLQVPCDQSQCKQETFTMRWEGANETSTPVGSGKLETLSHYIVSNDSEQWQTSIHNYKKVVYPQVYSGIDLVFYGTNNRQLEYDLIVAPGTDPELIRLSFDGVKELSIGNNGTLVLQMESGEIVQQAPVVYQQSSTGTRQVVAGKYRMITPNTVGFEFGSYDQFASLVVDPVIIYSSYLGEPTDSARGIHVAANGETYVTGYTEGLDFPVINAVQPQNAGKKDVFVGKLNRGGTAFEYATYLGGSETEGAGAAIGPGLAVNLLGEVYLTGRTFSSDFPLVNPLKARLHGPDDFFVTKLSSAGDQLLFSTYLGREDVEFTGDSSPTIAIDRAGAIFIQAFTDTPGFPVVNAVQASHAGRIDTLVMKLDPEASTILWATYLGGSSDDKGRALTVDRAGDVWVTGRSDSFDFPVVNALQPVSGGLGDVFITKIAGDGSAILFSTYVGGSNTEKGRAIVADRAGNIYVTGNTQSIDLPVVNPVQAGLGGGGDGFVMKLAADLSALEYLTYIGGAENDTGAALAVDDRGALYITGFTESLDFPLRSPVQSSLNGHSDAFVMTLGRTGNIRFSSYLGGGGDDSGTGIGIDRKTDVYIIGNTDSSDFYLQGELQAIEGGIFVSKISNGLD